MTDCTTLRLPAYLDDGLRPIIEAIEPTARAVGMTRVRAGRARTVTWAEIGGRHQNGAWLELRLHHRADDLTIRAGLLAYQPLSRGGRTVVVGETFHHYAPDLGPASVAGFFEVEIAIWLRQLD